ncbi:ATPase/histidine kinase/DNA gyrase B/HSP90 domain protein [[Clostridium] methylpentosum DSM 5476]|uniref:histidine kinase n=1 Tax=[Clostridium] methylpentosum DSM 5476 TaxID=537013 RepID=C0E9Y7_9FIRM|nr:ATPase/histidine kinase/DNA gyrase B/HSP90 domain protein [[Clostridium] methylpentosum DSM 5476]
MGNDMKKSLFAKYFTICMSVIIVSITFLGAMMLIFSSQYFRNDQFKRLEDSVQYAAELTVLPSNTQKNNDGSYTLSESVGSSYRMLSRTNDALYFLTDTSGALVACSEGKRCIHSAPYTVPVEIRQKTTEGIYKETGTFAKLYKNDYYTVGVPITIDGQTIGYLYASSPSKNLSIFLSEIFNMFIISSGVVLFLAFAIIFVVTSQMVKPLKEMSKAAKQYGEGDFSRRVQIDRNDEIGELASALNTMADDLSIIENSRRSFTANVSHELKTPMTTIGGFIDGILDGTIPEREHKKYLRIVSDEVKRLARLVRSMLNLSKIEAGEMTIKCTSFNMIETIAQTLFSFEQVINGKQLEIRGLDEVSDVWIEADEDLIHQVIYNLMDNAIKFVNEGGYIEFSFQTIGRKTQIGIKNSGNGLSKQEMNKVFDRFYKTDKSRGLDKNGVGLGLYIVRTVINLHDGEIKVRSKEGEYTEFVITLNTGKPPSKNRKSSADKQ